MFWRVLTRLLIVLAMGDMLVGATQLAHAIPPEGTYQWDNGPLSGTFVSDGMRIIKWSFGFSSNHPQASKWTDEEPIFVNDDNLFSQTSVPHLELIRIWWQSGEELKASVLVNEPDRFMQTFHPIASPVPSTGGRVR